MTFNEIIKVLNKDVDQCFVGINVSKVVGYNDDDNTRRTVRTHIPWRYRMRLGDTQGILRREVDVWSMFV